ncbi:hypothetical protein ACSQ67_009097 [Phaseolus vulgaris]
MEKKRENETKLLSPYSFILSSSTIFNPLTGFVSPLSEFLCPRSSLSAGTFSEVFAVEDSACSSFEFVSAIGSVAIDKFIFKAVWSSDYVEIFKES